MKKLLFISCTFLIITSNAYAGYDFKCKEVSDSCQRCYNKEIVCYMCENQDMQCKFEN